MKLFLSFFFLGSFAFADGVITYGGGSVQSDFYAVTEGLIQQIMMIPAPLFPLPGGRESIRQAFKETKVTFSQERLYWQGGEVLAINTPFTTPRTLQVSIPKWREMAVQPILLDPIIIHEILHLAQYNDEDYQLSQMLYEGVQKMQQGDISGAIMAFYLHDSNYVLTFSKVLDSFYKDYPNDYRLIDEIVFHHGDIRQEDQVPWLDIVQRYMKFAKSDACHVTAMSNARNDLMDIQNDPFLAKVSNIVNRWYESACSL